MGFEKITLIYLLPPAPFRKVRGFFLFGRAASLNPKQHCFSLPKTAQNALLLAVLKSTGLGRNNLFTFILKINSSKLGWFKKALYL